MPRRTFQVLRRGIEAAQIASVPQVLIAKLEERLVLSDHETADIGPRFIYAITFPPWGGAVQLGGADEPEPAEG